MPARRRDRIEKAKKRKSLRPFVKYIFPVVVALVFVATFFFGSNHFSKDRKLTMVVSSGQEVAILVFDPVAGEITKVSVPLNTEVDVARGLGKWRVGSVWELGKNEKLSGRLLTETVVKNFYAPATTWFSEKGLSYFESNIIKIFSATINPGDTNLNLIDRVRLAAFSLKVKEFRKTSLDLTDTTFLQSQQLRDGEEGYVVSKSMPQRLLVLFSDDALVKAKARAIIVNSTGNNYFARDLGKVIEVMGAKVVAVENTAEEESGCVVAAGNRELVEVVTSALGCEFRKEVGEAEMEIRVGKEFSRRF